MNRPQSSQTNLSQTQRKPFSQRTQFTPYTQTKPRIDEIRNIEEAYPESWNNNPYFSHPQDYYYYPELYYQDDNVETPEVDEQAESSSANNQMETQECDDSLNFQLATSHQSPR